MELKYVGSKAEINERGIFFKTGKHDKYEFIPIAFDIYRTLLDNKTFVKLQTKDINLKDLKKYFKDIDIIIEEKLKEYQNLLEKEKEEIKNYHHLSSIEKEAYLNNLEIMEEYNLQRQINKIAYFILIDNILVELFKKDISKLTTTFSDKSWHVFDTIVNRIDESKKNLLAKINVYKEKELLIDLILY